MQIKINKKYTLSLHSKPFLIAELSGNHNGSLKQMLKLVNEAIKSGVDAIKIQTYTADTITLNSKKKDFIIKDKTNPWKKYSMYELYQKAHTPWEWHEKIFNLCKKKGIICFSSPFDESAVDFLEKFDVPIYKIASFENNHYPLIKKIIKTKKPLIISLGMINEKELKNLILFFKKNKYKKYIFLKCTSSYPAKNEDLNLKTIPYIKNKYNVITGFSDHSLGNSGCLTAVALGANVIEKHFKLKRDKKSVDSFFSSDQSQFKKLKKDINEVWRSVGQIKFGPSNIEKKYEKFKRSIYICKDIKKGEVFNLNNLKIVRPAYGLSPKKIFDIIGKKSKKNLKKNTALKESHIA